ncbi:MAG UNVERIFIED_CONTAM: RNA pseudouridine synthase [Planctomycetaceae bacterium]|jgi:hypothetical protein
MAANLIHSSPASANTFAALPRLCAAQLVHRLDRGVSGLLVFAKTPAAAEHLQEQFSKHTADRRYEALAAGSFPESSGSIRSYLTTGKNLSRYSTRDANEGEIAITHWKLLARFAESTRSPAVSRLQIRLETGRRNQIRVHLAEAGHPVLGDPRYRPELLQDIPWRKNDSRSMPQCWDSFTPAHSNRSVSNPNSHPNSTRSSNSSGDNLKILHVRLHSRTQYLCRTAEETGPHRTHRQDYLPSLTAPQPRNISDYRSIERVCCQSRMLKVLIQRDTQLNSRQLRFATIFKVEEYAGPCSNGRLLQLPFDSQS